MLQMPKLTRESFHVLQANAKNALRLSEQQTSVLICAGTGCIAGGSLKIYENLKAECEKRNLNVYVGLFHESDEEHPHQDERLPRLL
jgi:NADH-quinone oxidoreductase subunit F